MKHKILTILAVVLCTKTLANPHNFPPKLVKEIINAPNGALFIDPDNGHIVIKISLTWDVEEKPVSGNDSFKRLLSCAR